MNRKIKSHTTQDGIRRYGIPDANRLPEERELLSFVRLVLRSSEVPESLKDLARATLAKARAA